jgi:hypothetical protein
MHRRFYLPAAMVDTGIDNDAPDPAHQRCCFPAGMYTAEDFQHGCVVQTTRVFLLKTITLAEFQHIFIAMVVQLALAETVAIFTTFNDMWGNWYQEWTGGMVLKL